jgi:hypothetical protein
MRTTCKHREGRGGKEDAGAYRVQEAQIMPRRLRWSPGGPDRAQEAQSEGRRPRWSPGGADRAQEAQTEPRRPRARGETLGKCQKCRIVVTKWLAGRPR